MFHLALSSILALQLLACASAGDSSRTDGPGPVDEEEEEEEELQPDDKRISFSAASADERAALIRAALGKSGVEAYRIAVFAADDADVDACPQVNADKSLYTATDCTSGFQTRYRSGSFATSTGVTFVRPVELEFNDFVVTESGEAELRLDGRFSQSEPGEADAAETVTDLRFGLAVGEVHIAQTIRCAAGLCTWSEDAAGELVGKGHFGVRGERKAGGGFVELRGQDLLRVDLAADGDGCVKYTIGGTPAGEVCDVDVQLWEQDPVAQTTSQCFADTLVLEIHMNKSARSVEASVRVDDSNYFLVLSLDPSVTPEGEAIEVWTVSAENLAIDCEAFDARGGARFDIVLDDGEVACQLHDPHGILEACE